MGRRFRGLLQGSNTAFVETFRSSDALGQRLLARWLLASYWSIDPYRAPEDFEEALLLLGIDYPAQKNNNNERDDDFDEVETRQSVRFDFAAALRARLQELEQQPDLDEPMASNVRMLAVAAGFSDVETQLFRTLLVSHLNPQLRGYLCGQEMSYGRSVRVLAWMMEIPESELLDMLQDTAPLAQSGLVIPGRGDDYWHEQFCFCPEVLSHIELENFSPADLMKRLVKPVPLPEMTQKDFVQIEDDVVLLLRCLQQALDTGKKGVNVLLYGAPGTGKTQLARLLVQLCDATGLDIRARNLMDYVRGRDDRFSIYRTVQGMAPRGERQIVVFDEVEDVFSPFERGSMTKATINFNLEHNRVPTIWITNSIQCIDNAFVRRFDIVLPVKAPDEKVRERILAEAAAPLELPGKMLQAIAAHNRVTPAVLSRAAGVVRDCTIEANGTALMDRKQRKLAADRVMRLVNNTLVCQGHAALPITEKSSKKNRNRAATQYDIHAVNASMPLADLAAMLRTAKEGRVALFGPPGTGKTAFVYEVAKRMKREVILCQPSDVQDKYIGETEKNMARLFERATKENAILFFDEFDSFLASRDRNIRSWETSQVNEMLTQLERFNGVLFAATNQRDIIDRAALRRFDFKVDFDWLKPEQAVVLFAHVLQQAGCKSAIDQEFWQGELACLQQLAPGDFAVAARQARLKGGKSALKPDQLLAVLREEVAAKKWEGESKPMGFLAKM